MAALALLLVLQDVDSWIRQLGDADYVAREEATQRLIDAGDAAVAPLRAARDATADEEISARIAVVLEAIERTRPLRELLRAWPTVTADATLMPDLAADLSHRYGVPIRGGLPEYNLPRRIENASLLAVCDEMARGARLAYDAGPSGVLFHEGELPARPTAYAGPFKFWLASADAEAGVVTVRLGAVGVGPTVALDRLFVDEARLDTGERLAPAEDAVEADPEDGSLLRVFRFESAVAPRRIEHLAARAVFIAGFDPMEWEWRADEMDGGTSGRGPCPAFAEQDAASEFGSLTFVARIESPELAERLADDAAAARIRRAVRVTLVDVQDAEYVLEPRGDSVRLERDGGAVRLSGSFQGETMVATASVRLRVPLRADEGDAPFEFRGIDLESEDEY